METRALETTSTREWDALLDEVLGPQTRRILNSIFDGVYITDKSRRIVFWNEGAERLTGYTKEEVQGRPCSDNILNHIDAEGHPLCGERCPLQRTIDSREPTKAKVYPKRKDGERFPVLTHIGAIKDRDGRTWAGIEVFRDISTEERFRSLQEKFNSLIRKYVSQSTYEEIVERVSSGDWESARRIEMTIMFVDICGFTAYSEANPPEEVTRLLNEVFGICEVITRESHGDIDKFIGDALMATFVDADDAVRAGKRVLGALANLNRSKLESGKDTVSVRIGVSSGRVMRSEVGTSCRKDRTVLGDPVNVAARMQEAAAPNSILVSEATRARLSEDHGFRSSGSRSAKGKKEPIRVFTYEAERRCAEVAHGSMG